MTTSPIIYQAWVYKYADVRKGYKRRWCIVQDEIFTYYKVKTSTPSLTTCKGSIVLPHAKVIYSTKEQYRKEMILEDKNNNKYYFKHENVRDMEVLVKKLGECTKVKVVEYENYRSDASIVFHDGDEDTNNTKAMSHSIASQDILHQGWLYKYANARKGYKRRWCIVQNDIFTYYKRKVGKPSLAECRGYMSLINAKVIYSDHKHEKEMVLEDENKGKYYFRQDSAVEMEAWVKTIFQYCSQIKLITLDDYNNDEYYGILKPQLGFALCNDGEKLLEMQQSDGELLNRLSSLLQGVGSVANVVYPPTVVIVTVLSTALPGIFNLLQGDDIQQALINAKIENAVLSLALADLQAEVSTIEDRYKQMTNVDTFAENRKLEVVTTIAMCKKILNCFVNEEHPFYSQAMAVSHYLVSFASLYACCAEIAVILCPHYKDELTSAMQLLIKCLEDYKVRVIAMRLEAVQSSYNYTSSNILSYGKAIATKPASYLLYKGARFALPCDKITDKMYPRSIGGFQEHVAYDRTGTNEDYQMYKKEVEKVFELYFDTAKAQILNLQFMTDKIGFLCSRCLVEYYSKDKYSCNTCYNFYLCSACYETSAHDKTHELCCIKSLDIADENDNNNNNLVPNV